MPIDQRREPGGTRLGKQIQAAVELSVEPRDMHGPCLLRGRPQHGQGIAKAFGAVVEVAAERRIFAGAVTGGQAEN